MNIKSPQVTVQIYKKKSIQSAQILNYKFDSDRQNYSGLPDKLPD